MKNEKRTNDEIIHDMEGVIFTRAKRAESRLYRENNESNISMWNEYKILLRSLGLFDEYEDMYGKAI